MNKTRMFLALVVVALVVVVYDYVFHGILLKPHYEATAHLWRAEETMGTYMPVMTGAQLFFSLVFVGFFAAMRPQGGLAEGLRFGLWVGVLMMPTSMIWYSVQPIGQTLLLAWLGGNLLESLLVGALAGVLYRA